MTNSKQRSKWIDKIIFSCDKFCQGNKGGCYVKEGAYLRTEWSGKVSWRSWHFSLGKKSSLPRAGKGVPGRQNSKSHGPEQGRTSCAGGTERRAVRLESTVWRGEWNKRTERQGCVWGWGGGIWELVIPEKPRVEWVLRREWDAIVLKAAVVSS